MKVYYFGEFGVFNYCVLGAVERYLHISPQSKFTIATHGDYFQILEHLFPGHFTLEWESTAALLADDKIRGLRKRHTCHEALGSLMHEYGYQHLRNVLGQVSPLILSTTRQLIPLISRIAVPCDDAYDRNLVSFCCRRRTHAAWRNLEATEWSAILKVARACFKDATFVFHGLPAETYDLRIPGAHTCSTVMESAHLLSRSRLLVTSMSGFAQFAANCGCPTLQVGDKDCFFEYSPFGTPSLQLDADATHHIGTIFDRFAQ